jgi:hypothetical protein
VRASQGESASAMITLINGGGARTEPLTVTGPGNAISSDHCSGSALAGGASCTFAVGYGAGLDETGTPTVNVEIEPDRAHGLRRCSCRQRQLDDVHRHPRPEFCLRQLG